MFAAILFEFAGQPAKREYFIFKLSTELGPIKKGDVVVVEWANPRGRRLGIFVRAFPKYYVSKKIKQTYISSKTILKKAHKNSLINLVKRRYDIVKDLQVPARVYERYKKDYKENQDKTPDEVRKCLMRNIILAAEDCRKRKDNLRIFVFGNMKIILKGNIVINLIPLN